MEPDGVTNGMLALIMATSKWSSEMVQGVFTHHADAMATIQSSLIHQMGANTDDPALLMALQAASGSPKQGAITS